MQLVERFSCLAPDPRIRVPRRPLKRRRCRPGLRADLPEGPRIQALLAGGESDFSIGMELELELETLRKDDEGRDVVIFRFQPTPAKASGAAAS